MIAMQYCTDGNLHELIQQHKDDHMKLEQVLDLFVQICRGTRYFHDKGVLHQNMKVWLYFVTLISKESISEQN